MDTLKFEDIQKPTWIRVVPPDDPFHSKEYLRISDVERMEYDERSKYYSKTTIPAHYKAYVHASIAFTPEGWSEPGFHVFFPEKIKTISDWDVRHATIVQKITKKTYRGIIKDVFEKKYNYERE